MKNEIIVEDIESILGDDFIPWSELGGKTVFITGATGLIGGTLVKSLLRFSQISEVPVKAVLLVRDLEKARKLFGDAPHLEYIIGDVTEPFNYKGDIDYIVHAASSTSSLGFVNTPVDTVRTALRGTENVLEFALEKKVKRVVYLSTMEVYGCPDNDEKIDEKHSTNIDTTVVRNCYPESKRMCENLCACYNKQFGVHSSVIRLTQTFGPGVKYDDGRVFAEFARCAIEGKNIVLHTAGDTKRSYLYTADAVRAILCVLLKGKDNEAYNAANEDSYCSIYEMACLVAEELAGGKISVERIIAEDIGKFGYAPTLHMNLDVSKLRALGWGASVSLKEMFERMIETMKNER